MFLTDRFEHNYCELILAKIDSVNLSVSLRLNNTYTLSDALVINCVIIH